MMPSGETSPGDRGQGDFFGPQLESEVGPSGPDALQDAPGTHLDNIRDAFSEYYESSLQDGRSLRNYEDGRIRLINHQSGVIQEERLTGKMLISLPNGRIIYQDNPGEPLLVYDTTGAAEPIIARVSLLRQGLSSRYVYNFTDHTGTHLIDLETLEYFHLPIGRPPRVRPGRQRPEEAHDGDPFQPVR